MTRLEECKQLYDLIKTKYEATPELQAIEDEIWFNQSVGFISTREAYDQIIDEYVMHYAENGVLYF